jgi:hypothetical protein
MVIVLRASVAHARNYSATILVSNCQVEKVENTLGECRRFGYVSSSAGECAPAFPI